MYTCILFSTLGGHWKDNGRLVSIFCLLLAHIQRHRYVVKKITGVDVKLLI